ncbi:MAG: hypothetical protein CBC27_08490 [Opitutia bacterium TMED67]|nr:MAG: hypothetical protein CBC27_08490 [Opitutae bacterium TMED67]
MLKDYFEVPNKPAIKSGNILSCDFTDHETFIPQPLDYTRGTIATYVDCNGFIKMSGVSDTNLVTNGTFETPVDSNQWLNFGSPLIAERSQTVAYEGSFSYHIKGDSTNDGTQATATQFTGDYVIGDTIRVRAYIYPITASSNQIKSGVANSNRSITTAVGGLVLNQWNFIEYYAEITTASNNYVTFLISGTAGEFYLDNVSVNKVDVETPRIDYLTEIGKAKELQKPSLLLEPQRTNLAIYSQDILQWPAFEGTRTANTAISPENIQNAGSFVENTANSRHRLNTNYISYTSGSTYTFTLFAKIKSGSRLLCINANSAFNARAYFNLVDGSIAGTDSGTANIEAYPNDWYRCSVTGTATSTSSMTTFFGLEDSPSDNGYQGDGTSGHFYYGLQIEQGSYPTSLIHTSGSAVTRNQDLANNAGQLGVFNDTEGVLYAEMASLANDGTQRKLAISDGTNQNVVVLQFTNVTNQLRAFLYNGALNVNMYNVLSNALEFNKIAFKFKENDFSLYVNGSEVATDPSGTTFSTGDLTKFNFNDGGISDPFHARIREIKVFRRALTDSELTELTNNIV